MKKLLTALLLISSLALCGLSVVQWQREAALRGRIEEITRLLHEENQLRVATEEKAATYEKEIARITQLRADTETRLLEVTDELNLTQADQLQRGYSLAVLAAELIQARATVDAAEKRLTETTSAIANRNDDVTAQNTAIQEANARLKQLATERDKAITELNARTKAYNDLVEKYNKLAK